MTFEFPHICSKTRMLNRGVQKVSLTSNVNFIFYIYLLFIKHLLEFPHICSNVNRAVQKVSV